ncbi:MAG: hypothetical protein AAF206_28715, partial [Bacteroidota bacterium]
METKKSNKWTWVLIALPILLIATCNVYVNTHQENSILEDYQVGDYFVFTGFGESGNLPCKIKEITPEYVVF